MIAFRRDEIARADSGELQRRDLDGREQIERAAPAACTAGVVTMRLGPLLSAALACIDVRERARHLGAKRLQARRARDCFGARLTHTRLRGEACAKRGELSIARIALAEESLDRKEQRHDTSVALAPQRVRNGTSDARAACTTMHHKLTALSFVFVTVVASHAHAQSAPEGERGFSKPLDAPTKALEIVVGTGWTQGYGQLQPGIDMRDVITPGIGVDLALMYRIDPHWAVGLAGQYQEFEAERASGARGMTAGLAAAYHVAPFARVDPWVQVGTGYRSLWETHPNDAPSTQTQGLELAKLSLGLDFRVSRDVAFGPVIGADISIPSVSDPRAATFVFAGAQARFDVTRTHVGPNRVRNEQQQITQARVERPPVRPVSPSINLGEELLAACKLDLGNIDKAPKFEFDHSELLPEDTAVLDQLIQCLTTGALKDASLELTGRADPRGTVDYNDKLGLRRANSVDAYLGAHGVGWQRLDVQTRGERDATGTDEATWAVDRRVDITLAR